MYLIIQNYYNLKTKFYRENSDETVPVETVSEQVDDEYLDCGKAVNFTYYDNLVGVARRHRHPNVPEPQVSNLETFGKYVRLNDSNYSLQSKCTYFKHLATKFM